MLIDLLVVLDFDPYFIFYFTFYHGNVNGNSDVLRYVYVSILVYFLDIRGSIGGFTEGIVEM